MGRCERLRGARVDDELAAAIGLIGAQVLWLAADLDVVHANRPVVVRAEQLAKEVGQTKRKLVATAAHSHQKRTELCAGMRARPRHEPRGALTSALVLEGLGVKLGTRGSDHHLGARRAGVLRQVEREDRVLDHALPQDGTTFN